MPYNQPVAVVTGASRGLGAAFAQVLAQEGYSLALGARTQSELQQVVESLSRQASSYFLNVSDLASVDAFYEKVMHLSHRRPVYSD